MMGEEAQGCLTPATIPQGQLIRTLGPVSMVAGVISHLLVFFKVHFSICFFEKMEHYLWFWQSVSLSWSSESMGTGRVRIGAGWDPRGHSIHSHSASDGRHRPREVERWRPTSLTNDSADCWSRQSSCLPGLCMWIFPIGLNCSLLLWTILLSCNILVRAVTLSQIWPIKICSINF